MPKALTKLSNVTRNQQSVRNPVHSVPIQLKFNMNRKVQKYFRRLEEGHLPKEKNKTTNKKTHCTNQNLCNPNKTIKEKSKQNKKTQTPITPMILLSLSQGVGKQHKLDSNFLVARQKRDTSPQRWGRICPFLIQRG